MATVEEIARGISQVLADSYDGATDEDGNPFKIGLKREMEADITDKRVMDGFGMCLRGNILSIKYQGDVTMKELKDKGFESDTEQTLADILKFVKEHYKRVTGSSLSCKPYGNMNMSVQSTSRVRNWVEAQMQYEITNMDGIADGDGTPTGDELLDKSIRDFLGMGKKTFGAKEASNVTRKEEKSE
tara:strand:- start:12502 stop:13059 length:558 start_codon:yes stop_codon:yes gene_type:complete